MDEGAIKFECRWTEGPGPGAADVDVLVRLRNALHALGLIGEYPNGVGFGNVSARGRAPGIPHEFFITGTQTGGLPELTSEQVTRVTSYDIAGNSVSCIGRLPASSESLTHAALYECSRDVRAVVHVHSTDAWNRLRGVIPTTRDDVPYGTPAMAHEISRLYRDTDLAEGCVAVMGGHLDGIISFGSTLDDAASSLIIAIR